MEGDSRRWTSLRTLWNGVRQSFTGREAIALGAAAVAYLVIHVALIVPGFGEDDSARIAVDAIGWHFNGYVWFESTEYRMRTSPLYIQGLKTAMDLGMPLRRIPALMNFSSVLASLVAVTTAYLLFRSIVGRAAAAIACALLLVSPAFFLAGIYGMAHVPALAAWFVSLFLFGMALDHPENRRRFLVLTGLSTVLAFMAFAFKADLVLMGLAFPGLALVKDRISLRTVAAACAIVIVGFSAQVLYGSLSASAPPRQVAPVPQSVSSFVKLSLRRYPLDLRIMTDKDTLGAITHSTGPFLFAVVLVALGAEFVRRGGLRLALFVSGWALPLMIFWSTISGNSARHNLAALAPLLLLVALLLIRLAETPGRAAALAGLVAFGNYFSDTQGERFGHGTMVPRTDLLNLARAVAAISAENLRWSTGFAALDVPKKAMVARNSLSHSVFACAATADGAVRANIEGQELKIVRKTGVQSIRHVFSRSPSEAGNAGRKLRDDGYVVVYRDFRL
jgi:hypothetical protein